MAAAELLGIDFSSLKYFATHYRLTGGTIAELCEHNAQVRRAGHAQRFDYDCSHTWTLRLCRWPWQPTKHI